jgi:formylmethanofuran dehydrogenase subunit E
MFSEISAAVASAKAALDIAKASHGLTNYNELVSAVSEVNAKLMDATTVALASLEKQTALTSEIAELKEKLREVENWEGQMKRYALFQFPTGALAYALQPGMEQNQPLHYLCASCVDKKQKSTLQPHDGKLYCIVCKIDIASQERPPIPVNRSRGSWMA